MTPADFKVRFPQFKDETDERVQFFIDDAQPYFNVDLWGTFYAQGLCFYVAHQFFVSNMYAKAGDGKAATLETVGGVTSKKVGDLQKNYSDGMATAMMNDPYLLSPYGREYLRLRRLIGGALGASAV